MFSAEQGDLDKKKLSIEPKHIGKKAIDQESLSLLQSKRFDKKAIDQEGSSLLQPKYAASSLSKSSAKNCLNNQLPSVQEDEESLEEEKHGSCDQCKCNVFNIYLLNNDLFRS